MACDLLLGLCEIPVPATLSASDLIWFQVGDAELHVFAEPAFDTAAAQHFCLEVPDLDALRERLAAAGFAIMAGSGISGRPRFFCRDPFGNNIEFTTIIGDYRLG